MSLHIAKDEDHPCWRATSRSRSHRYGGFGNTCERCGTPIDVNSAGYDETGIVSWVPVTPPAPYQPGSLQRAIYDAVVGSGVPMTRTNARHLTDAVVVAIEAQPA